MVCCIFFSTRYVSFDSNDNLFWPSNKLFQNVKIIHDDFMNSVMTFVLLFSFVAILDLARIHCASRISKFRIRISKLSKQYGLTAYLPLLFLSQWEVTNLSRFIPFDIVRKCRDRCRYLHYILIRIIPFRKHLYTMENIHFGKYIKLDHTMLWNICM